MSQPVHIGFLKIITSIGGWKLKTIKLLDYFLGSLIAFLIVPRKKISFPSSIKKILIIRPGGIGDAIFLLPILKSLKQQLPDVTVDILCETRNVQSFISQKDYYNRLFCYNHFNEFKIVFCHTYDIVIDTEQWHFFSGLVAFFCKTTYRIGFNTRPLRSKLFEECHSYRQDSYELDNFKNLFEKLLKSPAPNTIDNSFIVSAHTKQWAQTNIPENSISLFLGASIALRRLNKKQCLEIILMCLKKNVAIALLGGKDIQTSAEDIQKTINHPSVYNFAGKLSLEESAGIIQRSKLFIGPDSGLMHLACAVGTPVLGIFGPGNVKKWGPKGDKHHIISLKLSCSPCTLFGYTNPICHNQYQCMREIKMEEILNVIMKKQG